MRSDHPTHGEVRRVAKRILIYEAVGIAIAWIALGALSALHEFTSRQVAAWQLAGAAGAAALVAWWAFVGIRSTRRPQRFEERWRELKRVTVSPDRTVRGGREWAMWYLAVAALPLCTFGIVVGPYRAAATAMFVLALGVVWVGLRALDVRINKEEAARRAALERARRFDAIFGPRSDEPVAATKQPEWTPDPDL